MNMNYDPADEIEIQNFLGLASDLVTSLGSLIKNWE